MEIEDVSHGCSIKYWIVSALNILNLNAMRDFVFYFEQKGDMTTICIKMW